MTREVSSVVAQISQTESAFDVIVGITRGGVIPARLFCSGLHVKTMHCVSVQKQDKQRVVVCLSLSLSNTM